MITPLQKHPGQRGGFLAILLLAAATTVVWTTHPRGSTAPTAASESAIQRAASLPGAVAAIAPPERKPTVEPPARTIVADDGSRVIATGSTSYDETRTSRVGVPVHGWLKKTRATSLGRTVRAGETVGVVYSPEVYLATVSVVSQVRNYRGQAPLDAERWRLLRWGMRQQALSRVEKTFTPQAELPLIARVTGTVVAEAGSPAQLVEPTSGLELFTITDPTNLWAFVDVPAAVAARLTVGTAAKLTIEGVERPVTAKVAYVYRYVEDGMRKVRFDLRNPTRSLKPNLSLTAEFQLATQPARP